MASRSGPLLLRSAAALSPPRIFAPSAQSWARAWSSVRSSRSPPEAAANVREGQSPREEQGGVREAAELRGVAVDLREGLADRPQVGFLAEVGGEAEPEALRRVVVERPGVWGGGIGVLCRCPRVSVEEKEMEGDEGSRK